jgi:hypothetical protein
MKTNLIKKTTLGLIVFFLAFQSVLAQQNCQTDDFSTPQLWIHSGVYNGSPTNTVSIVNSTLSFKGTIGGTEDRLWRTANLLSTWKIEFDFTPTAQSNAAHTIFCYSSSNNDPWYTGTKGTITNHNACAISYISNGGDPVLNLSAQVGTAGVSNPNTGIVAPVKNPISTYYMRFERTNRETLKLSVFTDKYRTTHATGSPIVLTIPCNLNGLQFIQVANGWGSGTQRSLTATIDNLSLCPLQ